MAVGDEHGALARTAAAPGVPADALAWGICDALVFRRLTATSWAHLGGWGRGKGWAGVVDVATADEQLLARLPGTGSVHRFRHPRSERVLGPYYAVGGAVVRVSNDVFVLFGRVAATWPDEATDARLMRLADLLEAGVGSDISPSKKLADELEVLHAVRAVTTVVGDSLDDTLQRVTEVAAAALSCEIGLVRNRSGEIVAWTSGPDLSPAGPVTGAEQGPARPAPGTGRADRRLAPPAADLSAVLDVLQRRAGVASCCVQDIAVDAELLALRRWGVRSVLAVLIPPPVGGILVAAHTDAVPRGFTGLCQQLGRHVAEAAGIVAHTAALRDELRLAAGEYARLARRDPVTGLGNRLCWEEALDQATGRVEGGGEVTVAILDLDDLKQVNDTFGHGAGDDLLRSCAQALQAGCGPGETCVRIGGDEFGLLVPEVGERVRRRMADIAAAFAPLSSGPDRVAASVGVAEAGPGLSMVDAVRQADIAMYEAKRVRRELRGPAVPV